MESGGKEEINPNILKIIDCCEEVQGSFFIGVISSEKVIYIVKPPYKLIVNENYQINKIESISEIPIGKAKPVHYLSKNGTGSKLLVVKSNYQDVSNGSLSEINFNTNSLTELKDSSFNISSAVYWHANEDQLVYYSYGNNQGLKAGYYLMNKISGKDSLLLEYKSPIGASEMVNGFDLSPNNQKLLIPQIRTTQAEIKSPQILEYNIATRQLDTLSVEFDKSFVRIGLWLRYSPDGNRILYANFPKGAYTETTNDDSEVGIIELASQRKKILDVNTNPGGQSVQLAPTWSLNGKDIIFGSGKLFSPSGAKGFYSLYVLKNVEDPQNIK